MEKLWYVVNTYSGHEAKVKEKLEMRAESMGFSDYIFRVIVPEETVLETIKDLPYNIEVIDALFINPLDEDKLKEILENNKPILIYENVIKQGSLSSLIYSYIIENNYQVKIKSMGLDKNTIVPTGDIESLRKLFNLDKDSIIKNIETLLKKI